MQLIAEEALLSQKWYLDPDTFTEDPGDGSSVFKIYIGPDDIGTIKLECSVCHRQGQLAEGEPWEPAEDTWISCSETCRAVREYELSLQRKYDE